MPETPTTHHPIRRILPSLLVLAVFLVALGLLHRELHAYRWQDIREALTQIPATRLGWSLLLAAVNYLVLIGYEYLAVRAVRRPLSIGRISLASFTGFVVSYNIGALLGGTPIRYRLYSAWGFSAVEIVRLVIMLAVIFWLGLFALAGVVFVLEPFPIPERLNMPFETVHSLGYVLLATAAGYAALTCVRRKPIRIRGMDFELPGFGLTLAQIAVSALDLIVAAGCLYVLLPAEEPLDLWQFLGVFLFAWVATVFTHVPGGVGVFELVILTLAATESTKPHVTAALLVFRVIYYLLPLVAAAVLLGANEVALRQTAVRRWWGGVERWWGAVAPALMALGTLLAGTVMLLSGAIPVLPRRLPLLQHIVPLPLLEAAHFLASLAGAGLLLSALGLYRRLNAAYWLSVSLLAAGMVLAVLKGLLVEETVFLGIILVTLIGCRGEFGRAGRLLDEPLNPGWIGAVIWALGCSIGLGAFAYKHVTYSGELWWTFSFAGHGSRFLRATAGVLALLLVFAIRKRRAPPAPRPAAPDAAQLAAAAAIIAESPRTWPHLALLGDKNLLFNDAGSAFLMYAVQGRSGVALGGPVGPEQEHADLVWRFRTLCERDDGWPVFFQVEPERSSLYVDQGLTLVTLGEEARVALPTFSLAGDSRQRLRAALETCLREGYQVEVTPPTSVEPWLPRCREISDAWLGETGKAEKGFALGAFDEHYLRSFPLALVRQRGRLIGFGNLWLGADQEECAVDLVRYEPQTPPSVLDFIFLELLRWGQHQGYRWFNFGLAPLAGVEDRPLAPLWDRTTGMIFRHGDHFPNCLALRQYLDQYDPVWSLKYLASPGGLALPHILADVTTLIATRPR